MGAKIVERLLLELKGKLHLSGQGVPVSLPTASRSPQPSFAGSLGTVHGALVQMGYKPFEADLAIQKIEPQAEGKAAEALLREALAALA